MAQLFNVSPRAIYDARMVRRKDPDLAEAVRRGEITLWEAKKRLGLVPKRWTITLDPQRDREIIEFFLKKGRSKAIKEALRFYTRQQMTIH